MNNTALLTDLYELTMAATYFASAHGDDVATFDLFVRRLPPKRNYMVFAGTPSVLSYIESLHFSVENLEYLHSLNLFSNHFLDYLKDFKFTGYIDALTEGEIFFGGEPIIRVTAPLIEAQLIETCLINCVHLHSLLATKATRVISAAANKSVIDFGARRSHGKDAALAAAYSSYLVGAIGTSNVLAGSVFDIPVFGTMAHSFVQAFESEAEAFKAYLKEYPNNSTLLIDTYDPLAAVPLVAEIAKTLPHKIQAVRIDSGNLQEVAVAVRKALDEYGLSQTQIILSGDLDEQAIAELEIKKVPVDGYGVGTKMDISLDTPFLEMVYKLSHIEHHGKGRSTAKASPNKANLPGRKQIYRQYKHDLAVEDIIGLEGEELPGVPLLRPIIYNGRAVNQSTTLKQQRQRYSKRLKSFPLEMLSVGSELKYPVRLSDEMRRLIESIEA